MAKNVNSARTDLFREVKDRSRLIAYIEATTGTKGKRTGKSIRFNPCPMCGHKDCFTVFGDAEDTFKCHSCEAKGDVFSFAERYKHMKPMEALEDVARHFGVELPKAGAPDPGADAPAANPLQAVLEAAIAHYRAVLKARPDGVAYLTTPKPEGRGHTLRTVDAMEAGFTDGKLAEALIKKGIDVDLIKQSGLYVEKKVDGVGTGEWKDFFCAGLVVFPHRTETGEVGHFTIKDPRKRIDYQLRTEHRLGDLKWGNQKAIKHDMVIVCEGENDLASFLDVGVSNVLATLGQLSDEQIRWLLTRSGGKRFVLWFDYDTKYGENGQPPAGIKYTRKLYNHLIRQPECQVVIASGLMEPGEDPDDWIQKDRDSASKRIQSVIKRAHHPLLWELRVMPEDIRADANATLRWLDELEFFELLGLVPDLQRDAIILELQKLGFSRDAVLENIKSGYGLMEQLEELTQAWDPGPRPSEAFQRAFAGRIWQYFKDHGKFFVSNGETLHLFYHHRIYQIGGNTAWKALLHKEAGLNYTTQVAKFVQEEIAANCYNRGDRLDAFSWVHTLVEDTGPVLYLNMKDPANRIVRVQAGEAQMLENGTNPHAVLLAESSQMKPFTYDSEVNVAAAMRDLKALFFDALTCEPAQRYLILAWTLSAYLMPLSQTRALMKMEGGSGSGKTTAARFCSLLVYGADMVGRSSTAGDYSMGSTEPLIVKDNLETEDINKNALNFLLLAATGATNIKRSHGTESGVTTERLNCLVAITAIEPFAKPELINRTYIVDFSKRYQRTDFVETDTILKLTGRRNEILSAWIQILAEQVLPDLARRELYMKYIREQHRQFSKDRTTEYMALLVLIAKAILQHIPLPDELKVDAGDRAPEYVLLDAWVRYQDERARESEQGTNAVLQLIEGLRRVFLIDFSRHAQPGDEKVWSSLLDIEVHREAEVGEDGGTGRQVYWFKASTVDLLAMMRRYAREYGISVPFQNPRQLGVRMANEEATLRDAGWRWEHDKKVRGMRITRFSWIDDE